MQLKQQESSVGGNDGQHVALLDTKLSTLELKKLSSSLPLGQMVPLSAISGPTYVTAQLLVQQVAYKLSDKIFSYSPDSFDLDIAAKKWESDKEVNVHGYPTSLVSLQTRAGAGTFALGYIFSKDFDLRKRTFPQSLLAPSMSLRHLRASLDQLSLLYGVASPFVAHIAAANYSEKEGLVNDYETALQLADELGFGLVSSSSAYDSQHMSLFATLMAAILPSIHVYDGIRTSRETLRVIDTLSESAISNLYATLIKTTASINPRLDEAGKILELLQSLNAELGTEYQPFEYHGDKSAETVLVVFGSVEAQVSKQVATHLATNGIKFGVINVRLYRPFIEEAFISVIPSSAKSIAVLGQVTEDSIIRSILYSDVLTAVSFSDKLKTPSVKEIKYSASQALTPQILYQSVKQIILGDRIECGVESLRPDSTLQLSFWDVDDSPALTSPIVLGHLFSKQSAANVFVHDTHDNLTHGGIVRTDIRVSNKTIEAPYPIQEADLVYVGEEKLLIETDLVDTLNHGGNLVVKLSNFKPEDVDKRIPEICHQKIFKKGAKLFAFDPARSLLPNSEKILLELALLKLVRPDIGPSEYGPVLGNQMNNSPSNALDAIEESLKEITVPEYWAESNQELEEQSVLFSSIKATSFVGFDKEEAGEKPVLTNWETVAKAFAFKEVYDLQERLRPDLSVKTFKVTVKENRRLTPTTYDRNIFHIEFDLGDSGLTYQIGEALGIHSENDPVAVQNFITWYGLEANALVQVPSRENPDIFETRTVYQALVQNVDFLGKPPKRFYEALSEFATDEKEKQKLVDLGSSAGVDDFKKRSDVDTVTFADILTEFKSAHPSFHDLARIIGPLKRREYSIASAQAVTPNSVSLMIVVVDWVDGLGRKRTGHATRYLSGLNVGAEVTVSVKPSVMKLPTSDTAPLIMAGLGTGLAPFRAFVQYRAMQKAAGNEIGSILLYMGSRHQREEYLYGEEWEAYLSAGVVTLLGTAFSRDQPEKIYIQDRMRQTLDGIVKAYVKEGGSFYLCGPTWPVPDVTAVLEEAISADAKEKGKKVDPRKEIEKLKEEGRYVLEVY